MRTLIFLALLFPVIAIAQINRSAKELACESTKDYVVNKLFKGDSYKSISYGELKPWADTRSPISWTISHQFEVVNQNNSGFIRPSETHKTTYSFLFYLDKKMQVLKAESYTRSLNVNE